LIGNIGRYLGLIVFSIVLIFPFLWMISTSFKPGNEIFTKIPRWIPKQPTVENYRFMLSRTTYPVYYLNTLKVSIITTVFALVISVFAGYSLSRFRFRGRGALGVLIIAYSTFSLPFSTWMLKGYFDTIPVSLEEAAIIDGCRRSQVLFRIILPLSAPGLVAVAMFTFILGWREYIYALAFTRSENLRLLTVGLALMQGQHGRISWGQIMSGAVLACIPAILVFTILQKYMVQGFTRGAVKE